MYMQSLDTQICFRTFYYDFCVGFHSICQKSTLWKTAKSQVKTEHLDCSLSKIKIWNTRELEIEDLFSEAPSFLDLNYKTLEARTAFSLKNAKYYY